MATHEEDHHDYDEIGREIERAQNYILIMSDGDHTRAYMRGSAIDHATMLSGLFDEHPHLYGLMHEIKKAMAIHATMVEELGEEEAERAAQVLLRAMLGGMIQDNSDDEAEGEAPDPEATHSMEDMLRELGLDNK